jgi:hypothetical protein
MGSKEQTATNALACLFPHSPSRDIQHPSQSFCMSFRPLSFPSELKHFNYKTTEFYLLLPQQYPKE